MSNKVQNPNQGGSKSFLWALVAVVVVAIVVVAYIVINGQGAKTEYVADRDFDDVSMSSTVEDRSIILASNDASADAEVVQLYEDFSCHYCAMLAENTDEQMKDEIEAGNLVVELHPLNFLDQGNTEGHSTRALAAALSVADAGDPSLFWNFRTLLLEDQDDMLNQWSDEDFAAAAEAMGADVSVGDAIRNGDNMDRANELATANGETLTKQTGNLSSPRVLQDGQDVPVEDINQWIPAVLQG